MDIRKSVALLLTFAMICIVCTACKVEENNGEVISSSEVSSSVQEEKFELKAANPFTSFQNDAVIICWGDSLTEGMGMTVGYNYPKQLQSDLNGQYKVINAGVSGEAVDAIFARANISSPTLTDNIVFEKGTASVELHYEFLSVDGEKKAQMKGLGNELSIGKIIIDGQEFALSYKSAAVYKDGIYTLTRQNADAKLTLKKGTPIKFDYSAIYSKKYCNVILMGANNTGLTTQQLIEKYKQLGATSDKNIYIIPYFTENDVAEEFKKAFGDNAVDIRDYFMNHAHDDYKIEKTKMDEWCIKKGKVPSTFQYNNQRNECHLSDIGYKVMADQVYKKGVKLGYWK